MSFDLFVCRYRDKEFAAFGQEAFEAWFGARVIHRTEHSLRIGYADGSGDVYMGDDWDGFTVSRPGGMGLMQDLVAFADAVGAAIFWPGSPNCVVVTRAEIIPHLPDDLIETLGPVAVVTDGKALSDAIAR